jgi:predicted ATPase
LHVHTPASYEQHYGDKQNDEVWDAFIGALAALPPEITALGINDYFSVAGYRRVRAAAEQGLLPNIALILPVVELRLDHLAGHSALKKVNLHVVFSDELSADCIESFFLLKLTNTLHLDSGKVWNGCVGTMEGLADLGTALYEATPVERRVEEPSLRTGFRSASVSVATVEAALQQSVFAGKWMQAVGHAEWDQMRFDGAGAAQKRDVIGRVHFVLGASPTVQQYTERREQLKRHGVNDRLFHASDAHYFAESEQPNRLGQTHCWVKADLTFEGLRRAIRRFDERVYVGPLPPKLEVMRAQQMKYIRRIDIKKTAESALQETWFDSSLELNPDLVAVIGNQGGGKSALTDVLALAGNSCAQGFSFLTADRFRDKQGKASHFEATLTWEDGTISHVGLNDEPRDDEPERVRYVPQGFFEAVTNETSLTEGGKFYAELKKTVFSHVPEGDRLGLLSFDALVDARGNAVSTGLLQLRQEMTSLNAQIIELEEHCSPAAVRKLAASITQRESELATLREHPPTTVAPPLTASAEAGRLQELRETRQATRSVLDARQTERALAVKQQVALDTVIAQLQTVERQVQKSVATSQRALDESGVAVRVADTLRLTLDLSALTALHTQLAATISACDADGDESVDGSPAAQARAVQMECAQLESLLEAASARHQGYLRALAEWTSSIQKMEGNTDDSAVDSLSSLRTRRHDLTSVLPAKIAALDADRMQLMKEIHGVLLRRAAVYTDLTKPVQAHIEAEPLTRDRYRLSFSVALADAGLADRLFNCVNQTSGTFAGVIPGRERLRQLIATAEFGTPEGITAFVSTLMDHLNRNQRSDGLEVVEISALLKKGATLQALLDLVFSLEYLAPSFALALDGKPLRQLSAGERGTLLLVFYLLVDRSDIPLIIDQPEGNLNNQSIVEHLVPIFIAAKARRQVIMVTHNPNLAVVCDAEQLVHCRIAFDDGCRVEYTSGAPENPQYNQHSLDVLEGTARAFVVRHESYADSSAEARLQA